VQLVEFNQASEADVKTFLKHCVQIESWANELLSQRPYASLDSILEYAAQAARTWSWEEIKSALDNHPRIGEKKPKLNFLN
jgi:2-oxo-4-hydroxy-4-carboxy-5-ureidoimidazoline decarboxylase